MSRNAQALQRSRPRCVARLLLALALCSLPPAARAQRPLAPATNNAPHARVVIVENPDATQDLRPVPEVIQSMMDRAITNLTGKSNALDAWRSLVSADDTIGLKVCSTPGPNSGTRPVVVASVIQGLLAAGIPPGHIIVWDKRSADLRQAGFFEFEQRFGIRVLGSQDAGYDDKIFYETAFLGSMSPDDLDFRRKDPSAGRKSYASKLLTGQLTKIINLTPLMPHHLLGVSGNLYTLAMGSVDNTQRFENNTFELSRAVPEIYALSVFGDRVAGEKVVLTVVDALICQYEGQQLSLLHYSTVLNQLRFSRDPVALDVLSLQEINRQCELAKVPRFSTNISLLPNASLLEIGVSDPARIDRTTLR